MNSILKEFISTVLILIILVVIFLSIELMKNFNIFYIVAWFFGYLLILFFFNVTSRNRNNKLLNIMLIFLNLPITLLIIFLNTILPFLILFLHVFFYFGLPALIIELIFTILLNLQLLESFNTSTLLYLKLTSGVFLISLFNPILKELVIRLSIAQPRNSFKMKVYDLEHLTKYLLTSENIKFLIYFFYVIALLFINILNFEGLNYSSLQDGDKAILQSFVTFIAFDRAIILSKQNEFRPSKLLKQIYQSVLNDTFKFFKDGNSNN